MSATITPNGRRFLEAAGLALPQIDLVPERGWFDDLASPRVGLVSEIPRSQRMREFGCDALPDPRHDTGSRSAQGLPIPTDAHIASVCAVYGDEPERVTISAEPYWRCGTVAAINRVGDDLADMLTRGKYRIAPPLGRPPLPPGAGRTARVEWRTTPATKTRAQELADAAGLPLSAWLDGLVERARK